MCMYVVWWWHGSTQVYVGAFQVSAVARILRQHTDWFGVFRMRCMWLFSDYSSTPTSAWLTNT